MDKPTPTPPEAFSPVFAPQITDEMVERGARVLTNIWGDAKQETPTWIKVVAHRVLMEALKQPARS